MFRYIKSTDDIFGMTTIGRSDDNSKDNFLVAVNPDSHRAGVCYLKYYNTQRIQQGTTLGCRISLQEPVFIYHKWESGVREWKKINKDDIKVLCNFLDSASAEFKSASNWEMTLYHWNFECGLLDRPSPSEYNSKIEAFISGYYDSILHDPSYMFSTSQRPDYEAALHSEEKVITNVDEYEPY